eukprot:193687-Lingulodinium_polyedra.AAC.1
MVPGRRSARWHTAAAPQRHQAAALTTDTADGAGGAEARLGPCNVASASPRPPANSGESATVGACAAPPTAAWSAGRTGR